ncbi:helix-turn-helix domain-containing protein [Geoalkalibacter halelectricus]|uniref:helix-turn-helix domain-containing protein n=1 Tax=Geoalkalibacter halelectricus TaxID=2847045 RepID=UPI003D1D120E
MRSWYDIQRLKREYSMSSAWGERIRELRQQSNLSQKEFAERLGIAAVTLNRIENGHRHPDIHLLEKIAGHFQISLDWLVLGRDQEAVQRQALPLLPLLSVGDLADDRRPPKDAENRLWLPNLPSCDFALRIKDTAMEPLLRPGDIVLVALEPGEVGDVVVVRDATGIVRVRRQGSASGTALFVPENPDYPFFPPTGEVAVIGKVVGRVSCVEI